MKIKKGKEEGCGLREKSVAVVEKFPATLWNRDNSYSFA